MHVATSGPCRAACSPMRHPEASAGRPVLEAPGIDITDQVARFGQRSFALDDIEDYRIEHRSEQAPIIGNIIMANVFVAAALAFLLPILANALSHRFWMAVALFGLLALAAFDDVIRSRPVRLYRLLVRGRDGSESLAYTTASQTMMLRVIEALEEAPAPAGAAERLG